MFLVCVVLCLFLVVSTSAIDCLERLISEMTYYVKLDVKPYTLTHSRLGDCRTPTCLWGHCMVYILWYYIRTESVVLS